MDTFAHALWSYIIFHNSEFVWYAVLAGILPDVLSWGIYMVVGFYQHKGKKWGKPDIKSIPRWVFTLYGITHSIFSMILVFTITSILLGEFPYFLLAWPIHVLIDIPTHSRDFLPTPFLWPVSDWKFPGFSWGQKWFMIVNYSLLVIAFLILLWP